MGSRVLSGVSAHALLWPPVASSARPKLSFANPASSSNPSSSFPSSRLVISRAPLGVHVLVRRSRKETVVSRRASEEEGVETVDSAESEDVEAGEAVEEAEAKIPRKPIVKLGDIMGILNKRAIEASEKERPVPDIRVGDVVQIKLEVPENRRRASIYKGIVMSKQNAGIHTTIRIRRIIAGIGVEIVFPVYSPNIKEMKVVSHRKVRRARLYYLREKLPRLSTFK